MLFRVVAFLCGVCCVSIVACRRSLLVGWFLIVVCCVLFVDVWLCFSLVFCRLFVVDCCCLRSSLCIVVVVVYSCVLL